MSKKRNYAVAYAEFVAYHVHIYESLDISICLAITYCKVTLALLRTDPHPAYRNR